MVIIMNKGENYEVKDISLAEQGQKNVEWAESSAAPTFGEIMKFLLGYAKIKPTEATKP